ncbi:MULTISPECIES: hypothetical protein [unclassified Kribbella]
MSTRLTNWYDGCAAEPHVRRSTGTPPQYDVRSTTYRGKERRVG